MKKMKNKDKKKDKKKKEIIFWKILSFKSL
jgi:hypothetical protein